MAEMQIDFVTLKPRWSILDLFGRRGEHQCKARILKQLNYQYLSQGWELEDDIYWSKNNGFAVMKIGRRSLG